ncbi:MAG TPA: hypothetical protein VGC34_16990 [Steroidobacteraceae bacterium]
MKKTASTFVRILASLAWVGAAHASQGSYQGTVTSVFATGGIVLVTVSNGAGQLICSGVAQFWVDPSTDFGRTQMALAMAAKASGALVYVQGNGACSTAWPYNNTEQLVALNWE